MCLLIILKIVLCTVNCIYVKLCFWVPQFQYEISVDVKAVKFNHCFAPRVICKEHFYNRNGKFYSRAVMYKPDLTWILSLSTLCCMK